MPPSSLSSQAAPVLGPVSLSLLKLSFCTTPTLRSNLLWTHLPNRDNLFAVFDSLFQKDLEGSVTEKKVLKLVRGSELLETIDLRDLFSQARLDEERSRSQQLQDADRHVIVMVKKPLLAIRYQLPTGQFRRLQMNFRPESGFDYAHSILQALALPVRDRSQSSNLVSSQPPTPTVTISNPLAHYHQPASLMPSPEFFSRPITSNGPHEHKSLATVPEPSQERPATAPMTFSEMLPPRQELPFAKVLPWSHSPALQPPPPLETLNDSQPQGSQKSKNVPAKRKSKAKTAKAASSEQQTGGASHGPVQGKPNSTNAEERNRSQSTKQKAAATETSKNPTAGSGIQGVPLQTTMSAQAQEANAAPSQNLLLGNRSKTTTSTKRSRKQPAKQSAAATEVSRKLIGVANGLGLSPQTQPSKQARQQSIVQDSQNGQENGASITAAEPPAQGLPGDNTREASETTASSSSPLVLHVGKWAMSTLAPSEADARQEPAFPTPRQGQTNTGQEQQQTEISPMEFMSNLDEWVRKYQDLPAPRPREAPQSDLAAYAAQSDKDRLTAIDNLICDCLGDENFLKLVEDVDRSWKRIGLGF